MTTATAIIAAGVFLTILGAAAALVIARGAAIADTRPRPRPDQDTQP
jgi:hypothetical protein